MRRYPRRPHRFGRGDDLRAGCVRDLVECFGVQVGDEEVRACFGQMTAKITADMTQALYRDGAAGEVIRPEGAQGGGLAGVETRDELRLFCGEGHVLHGDTDVFGRPVSPVERVDGAAQGTEQIGGLVGSRIAPDHRLATAERQVGHGVLVTHALGEAQRVDESVIRGGVVPHAATASGGTQRRGVKRYDGAQAGLHIKEVVDTLVAGEGGLVEHRSLRSALKGPAPAQFGARIAPSPGGVNIVADHEIACRRAISAASGHGFASQQGSRARGTYCEDPAFPAAASAWRMTRRKLPPHIFLMSSAE